MADNPALRRRDRVRIVRFDGTESVVPGVARFAETSAGDAGAPYGDKAVLAWIDYGGDIGVIEFADVRIDNGWHRRRVIKAERVGSVWPTVKLNLGSEATPAVPADFDAADFDPIDFNAA